ncbi:hypothetical protein OIU78_015485 [Salix suchowensis]|nr:hypothetical protein OIU78_015485 [Salix suchowensis]
MDFQPSHVGYGFHPTDEVLVNHYLRLKMLGGHEQDVSIIEEVNVCDYEPWELPGLIGNQDPNDPNPTFSFHNQREFVLCKLKKDPEAIMPAYEEGEAGSTVTSHHLENQNSDTATSEIIP